MVERIEYAVERCPREGCGMRRRLYPSRISLVVRSVAVKCPKCQHPSPSTVGSGYQDIDKAPPYPEYERIIN
jgi:hypothetical protein